jgi:hypothetical protein
MLTFGNLTDCGSIDWTKADGRPKPHGERQGNVKSGIRTQQTNLRSQDPGGRHKEKGKREKTETKTMDGIRPDIIHMREAQT